LRAARKLTLVEGGFCLGLSDICLSREATAQMALA
jgi:hypothetical protein